MVSDLVFINSKDVEHKIPNPSPFLEETFIADAPRGPRQHMDNTFTEIKDAAITAEVCNLIYHALIRMD